MMERRYFPLVDIEADKAQGMTLGSKESWWAEIGPACPC